MRADFIFCVATASEPRIIAASNVIADDLGRLVECSGAGTGDVVECWVRSVCIKMTGRYAKTWARAYQEDRQYREGNLDDDEEENNAGRGRRTRPPLRLWSCIDNLFQTATFWLPLNHLQCGGQGRD